MHIDDCYRILKLPQDASLDDIKSAYRRLALQYHPDVNQSDPEATEKFRKLKEAYDIILQQVPPEKTHTKSKEQKTERKVRVNYKPRANATSHYTSKTNNRYQDLKQELKRVQNLIKERNYYDTVWVVEQLRRRYPNDPEVARWQAIAYYHRGNELLQQGRSNLAREYLTKALIVDPQNRELCFMAKRALDLVDNKLTVLADYSSRLAGGIIWLIVLIVFVFAILDSGAFTAFVVIPIAIGICMATTLLIGIISFWITKTFGKSARFNKK
jgi:DnaJ-domain-containing protein 1